MSKRKYGHGRLDISDNAFAMSSESFRWVIFLALGPLSIFALLAGSEGGAGLVEGAVGISAGVATGGVVHLFEFECVHADLMLELGFSLMIEVVLALFARFFTLDAALFFFAGTLFAVAACDRAVLETESFVEFAV